MTDTPAGWCLPQPPQTGKYRALLLDPPWQFKAGTKGRPQHYGRLTDAELAALPLKALAHPDGCWVFVWCTGPKTEILFRKVAPAWGVKYSARAFIWTKLLRRYDVEGVPLFTMPTDHHVGQGYTTRKNAEDCWLFKFGRPKRVHKGVRELITSPLREHSRKPDETHARIEQFCAGPYAELFARAPRTGWDCYGDQVDKFAGAA